MRFPFITLFFGIILCGTIAFSYRTLTSFGKSDIESYQELVKSVDPKNDKNETPYKATQQHQHTHKDLWFIKSSQRLQLRLRSKDTDLVFDHHDDKTEVMENMRGVTCCMQEELYYVLPNGKEVQRGFDGHYFLRNKNPDDLSSVVEVDGLKLKPMQVVRYLEADTATYFYQSDRFTAEQVKVSRYIVPGHSLMESAKHLKPFMTGIAHSVEFSLVGNDFNFTAYQMKANLHTLRKSS